MKKSFIFIVIALCSWKMGLAQLPYSTLMGGSGETLQFVSELTDVLYAGNSRFSVTPNNLPNLFTNSINLPNWTIPAGTASTITIDLTGKGEVSASGVTNPNGFIYVSFYSTQVAASVTGQAKYSNGTWIALGSFVNISPRAGAGYAVFQGTVGATNFLTAIQLTITAPAGAITYVSKIEYHRFNADYELLPAFVTKNGPNKLYGPLYFQDGNNVNQAFIAQDGSGFLSKLGIGIATPTAQLHTTGTVRLAGVLRDNTQARVIVSDTNGNISYRDASTLVGTGAGWTLFGNAAVNPATSFIGTTDNTPVAFRTNNLERMRVDINGNILIGKTSQTNTGYILDVNGSARINKITINSTGADYVFDPGYSFPSLPEVEAYINRTHHLPGIPSASRMQKEGLELGEMQTTLLQKIEELTLYLVEEHKRTGEQQKEIEGLKAQNKKLDEQQQEIDQLKKMILSLK